MKVQELINEFSLIKEDGWTYLGKILRDDRKLQTDAENITSIRLRFQKGFFYLEYETISKLLKIYKFGYDMPNIEYRKTEMAKNWSAEYQPFFNENIVFMSECKNIVQLRHVFKLLKI